MEEVGEEKERAEGEERGKGERGGRASSEQEPARQSSTYVPSRYVTLPAVIICNPSTVLLTAGSSSHFSTHEPAIQRPSCLNKL